MEFKDVLRLAENGDLDAMYYVGNRLYTEHEADGEERAVQEALPWFQRAAQGGHVESMYAAGNLLFGLYDDRGDIQNAVEQSLPWFRRAAEKGHEGAAEMLIPLGIVRMGVSREDRDFDVVEDSARAVVQAAMVLLDGDDPEKHAEAIDALEKALYALGLVMYVRKQKPQAISYLSKIGAFNDSCPVATVLWGVCEEDPREKYKLLKILERGVRSLLPPEPDDFDDIIMTQAVGYMSMYYRLMDHDLDRAYALLSEGLSAIRNPDCQEMLQREQAHFRKKMFGGWQYVE